MTVLEKDEDIDNVSRTVLLVYNWVLMLTSYIHLTSFSSTSKKAISSNLEDCITGCQLVSGVPHIRQVWQLSDQVLTMLKDKNNTSVKGIVFHVGPVWDACFCRDTNHDAVKRFCTFSCLNARLARRSLEQWHLYQRAKVKRVTDWLMQGVNLKFYKLGGQGTCVLHSVNLHPLSTVLFIALFKTRSPGYHTILITCPD